MRFMTLNLVAIFFSLGLGLQAQSKNIFLDRNFWKSNPSIETLKQYRAAGYDITELNINAFDAVVYALLEKVDNTTIEYMLTVAGNDVNKITHDGRTYMFWAAYKGNLAMMRYLLDHGARMDVVDSHGYTVMNFAASTGQIDTALFDLCLENGAQLLAVDHRGANALLLSAPYQKDGRLIDYFTARGLKLSSVDRDGNGLFNYAAKGGNLEYLQFLIDKGLPYNTLNNAGGNAVLFAARGTRGFKNGLSTYQFLKEKGLEMTVTGKGARNALHYLAGREQDGKVLQFFLDEGVKADAPDKEGNTPFMWAARSNSLEVITMLRSHIEHINQSNMEGQTALTMSIRRNKPEVVQYLITQGADVSQKDINGNSLAYYWLNSYGANAIDEFERKLQLLQGSGFTFSSQESKGHTLYHIAVGTNNLNLVKRLASFDIDIDAKNEEGFTALHLAAMKAHNTTILEYLISQGADKTILTDFEESVYDLAAENELLITEQVDIGFLK